MAYTPATIMVQTTIMSRLDYCNSFLISLFFSCLFTLQPERCLKNKKQIMDFLY